MTNIIDIIITRPFGIVLMMIFEFVESYGLSIILFTAITKLIVLPLTIKGKKGTNAITSLQPKVNELQKKYKDDKEKLNIELNNLYRDEGINPLAGCLPTLLTFPIMIGLYYVVQRPLTFMMGLSQDVITKIADTLGIVIANAGSTPEISIAHAVYSNFDKVSALSPDIIPIDFNFLGINLAGTPSLSSIDMLWIIPILSGITSYLLSALMMKFQGNAVAENPVSKSMSIMMPLMSVWISFILPASLGLYWISGNIFMMIQEYFLHLYLKKDDKSSKKNKNSIENNSKKSNDNAIENNTKKSNTNTIENNSPKKDNNTKSKNSKNNNSKKNNSKK